ncbi:hypothetical protein CC80DRAFT_590444 [Byssothecium circinans]|uniref:F-box domain-containing protein n=1 Tax=Byssothecium circinans TaxID=147558 RepID=A0A6A5U5G6_9PLEO|nr:hypothetical protein CC80DRAFT_590444 [Byssothecium circinans]
MVKLIDLPSELLLDAFSYLATGNEVDVKTLLSLCRTSRLLRDIAQPALHTCVWISDTSKSPLGVLQPFFRTILGRPTLAKTTRELALVNDKSLFVRTHTLDRWNLPLEDKCSIEVGTLRESFDAGKNPSLCFYPLAVEILARLENLQHIRFTDNIGRPNNLMQRVHRLQSEALILSRLKTFCLHKRFEDGPVNIDPYISLLQYPSFQEFTSEIHAVQGRDEFPPHNSISHSIVGLHWCIGPLETMERLIDACSGLEAFSLVIPDNDRFRRASDTGRLNLVTPGELVTALLASSHRHTLTVLLLDFHHYYDLREIELEETIEESNEPLESSDYVYPSFGGFENLTRLTIEFEKLLKVSYLPASLELLKLEHCRFAELDRDRLDDLIRVKETWCPLIQYVTVVGYEMTDEGITMVSEHAEALKVPFYSSSDGRVLTFSGAGRHLRIESQPQLERE